MKKVETKEDFWDTHFIVEGFGSEEANQHIKELLKEQLPGKFKGIEQGKKEGI